jgi:hypothetical protein
MNKVTEDSKQRREKRKVLEKEKERELEREKARKAKALLEKVVESQGVKKELSWQKLQELKEMQRKERIEAMKQELLASSALPARLAESMSRAESVKSLNRASKSLEWEPSTDFKADDPDKVR